MKYIILITLLLNSLLFGNEDSIFVKLNSQEIQLTSSNSNEEIKFYDLKPDKYFEKNKFNSCIIEENLVKESITLYCTHKNMISYFSKIDGVINPENKLFSYSVFLKLNNLQKEINKLRGK